MITVFLNAAHYDGRTLSLLRCDVRRAEPQGGLFSIHRSLVTGSEGEIAKQILEAAGADSFLRIPLTSIVAIVENFTDPGSA